MPTEKIPFSALLIDDELIACNNLQNLIREHWPESIDIKGMAFDTKEAELLVRTLKPDVIFLDIELRHENAFAFLERIKPFSFEVIFVTAYHEYALKALKLSALDYILKPICIEELGAAIAKLEAKSPQQSSNFFQQDHYAPIRDQLQRKAEPDRIVLKSKMETQVIPFDQIMYVAAKRAYSCFYFKDGQKDCSLLMSKPIAEYTILLPEKSFFRIHKSYLINCRYIHKLLVNGENHAVLLRNGTELPISRRRCLELHDFLKEYTGAQVP